MRLETYTYAANPIRTLTDETGKPWFLASDVTAVLGYANGSAAVAQHVDAEDVRRATLAIHEGSREVTRERALVNESGLYALTFGSTLEQARAFRRWVTSEVLPAIRRTGAYQAPELSGAELMALAVLEAQQTLAAREARIRELQPKADVFDELLTAEGSYSVGDAAKILTRAGIDVGQNRLFKQLDGLGWTFRKAFKRHVSQKAVEQGLIVTKPQTYAHPKTGERVIGDPQVRLTAKGLYRLRDELQPRLELEEAA